MFLKQGRWRDADRKNIKFLNAELHGKIFSTFGAALRRIPLKFLYIAGKQREGKEKTQWYIRGRVDGGFGLEPACKVLDSLMSVETHCSCFKAL